jgi:hypothetical protein
VWRQYVNSIASDGWVDVKDKLEAIQKEAFVTWSWFYHRICVGVGGWVKLRGSSVRIACDLASIRFEYLPDASPERYCYCNLLDINLVFRLLSYIKPFPLQININNTVPCWRYLLRYWRHHSVCYTALFTTLLVVLTISSGPPISCLGAVPWCLLLPKAGS